MATTLPTKKPIPHLGKAEKKKLEESRPRVAYATYEEAKAILPSYDIPRTKAKERVVFVIQESPVSQKRKEPSLKDELRALGFKVLQKSTLGGPHFKVPVPESRHSRILEEIKGILGVNQENMAAIVGCSARTVWRVLSEKNSCFKTKSHIKNFSQLVELMNLLLGIFSKKEFQKWLNSPQPDFKNKKPLDLLLSGNSQQAFQWAYMELEGRYS